MSNLKKKLNSIHHLSLSPTVDKFFFTFSSTKQCFVIQVFDIFVNYFWDMISKRTKEIRLSSKVLTNILRNKANAWSVRANHLLRSPPPHSSRCSARCRGHLQERGRHSAVIYRVLIIIEKVLISITSAFNDYEEKHSDKWKC